MSRLTVLFLVFCALAPPGLAQTTVPLTLDAAIAEALARNLSIAGDQAVAAVARHRPAQERSLAAPMFDAQIWRWPLTTLNPGKVDMFMFGAEQTLPARGKRTAAAAVAEREADLAQVQVTIVQRDVVAAVTVAYADLIAARRARGVYAEALAALRQLGDASIARYAAASLGQQDVLKVVVELSRLHQELIDLDENQRMAEVQLATLLGRDPGASIGEIVPPPAPPGSLSPATLTRVAEANVPQLQVLEAELRVAKARVDLARLERKPEFIVRGGYMLMPGEAGAWTASAGLTWPQAPWSRGRLDALDAERRSAVTAAEARIAAARQDIRAGIQQALIALDSARARVDLLRSTLIPQSNQSLEVSRIAYSAGQLGFLEVIDNQRVQLDAELELIRAEGAVHQAGAALERAIGVRLLTADVQANASEGK